MNRKTGWSPDESEGEESAGDPAGADQIPIEDIIRTLVADSRAYAATEAERQKLRAGLLGAAGRDAALLIIVALFLLFGALVALLVGLIGALAPLTGILSATLIVVGVTIAVVLLLLVIARGRVRSAVRIVFPKSETDR